MSARVYILLDIFEGKSEQASQELRDMPGVIMADCLEGCPSVLVAMEAANRPKLVELLMTAVTSVSDITKDLRLLVTRDAATIQPCTAVKG